MNIKELLRQAKIKYDKKNVIDIVELAKSLDIEVYGADLKDENSFIEFDKNNNIFQIYVNNKHSKARQRFSIAHEIGHFLIHKEKIKSNTKIARQHINSLNYIEEKKADKIASKLLLPSFILNKFIKQQTQEKIIAEPIINKIMRHFEVSRQFASYRLKELGYYVFLGE